MRPAPRLLLCALLLACGEPPTFEAPPPIEVSEPRCGPQRLPALAQPRRILPLPGDRLGILGIHLHLEDERRFVHKGAWVVLDPTGAAPPVVELTEQPIYDGLVKGDALYLLEERQLEARHEQAESLLFHRRLARFGEARPLTEYGGNWTRLAVGFGSVITGGHLTYVEGSRSLGRLHTREWPKRGGRTEVFTYWSNLGHPRGEGVWNNLTSVWQPATERLVSVGRLHVEGDPDDADDPGEHFGYSLTHGYTLDPRSPLEPVIRPLSYKLHPQRDFEPFGAVTDRDGDPWLLAVEGHDNNRYPHSRYHHAQPFMVRLDPRTQQWTARIDPELPPAATQGALLDAVSLADGGWIIGGAACDEEREWCRAWVARLDRSGRTVWSRDVSRERATVVRDLHVDGDTIYAAIAGGPFCCQFDDIKLTAWLWTLDLAEGCAEPR